MREPADQLRAGLPRRDRDRVECYAKRLLNPFRGAINVVRYQSAEAVTTDGVHWDIYVSNDALAEDVEDVVDIQTSDVRYGSWNRRQGLKRGPIVPSDDFRRLENMGAVVYEHLCNEHRQVPFPFRDRLELWLVDRQGHPVALINSEVFAEDIENYQILDFRAGLDCRQSFRPDITGLDPADAGDWLDRHVNEHCRGNARWFLRAADGSGTALGGHRADADSAGHRLGPERFPRYFLREPADSATGRLLVADYIAWQAPWFLLLDTLEPETRAFLEQAARSQALKVDATWQLYPAVIDPSFLAGARIEARLRRSADTAAEADNPMSTFYIELNPGPSD